MAGFTLLTLLDDIASILDDVALMTKTAAGKTVGLVGDDLALTTEQLSGFKAAREIPVVVAVAKGSMVNKLILIPAAILLSSFLPELLDPLLMVGGSWLCLEGAEKALERLERLLERKREGKEGGKSREGGRTEGADLEKAPDAPDPKEGGGGAPDEREAPAETPAADDPLEREKRERLKIRGAVRTDFVLSAEIITIALGTIPASASFPSRTGALILVGVVMTVGVYGVVAGIVKLDDLGFLLLRKPDRGPLRNAAGKILVKAAPPIMKLLAVAGAVAMFLVGGGIILHKLPFFHSEIFLSFLARLKDGVPFSDSRILEYLGTIFFGLILGLIVSGLLALAGRLLAFFRGRKKLPVS
ncbi:MAG: DUF808 domain-containing protein [Deltaproteobacteria bacterium]|jgi:predicted DNA repair protein MutK|nr:DUF808 domain-containing protein [Deltaproteobacteria bacterium]